MQRFWYIGIANIIAKIEGKRKSIYNLDLYINKHQYDVWNKAGKANSGHELFKQDNIRNLIELCSGITDVPHHGHLVCAGFKLVDGIYLCRVKKRVPIHVPVEDEAGVLQKPVFGMRTKAVDYTKAAGNFSTDSKTK